MQQTLQKRIKLFSLFSQFSFFSQLCPALARIFEYHAQSENLIKHSIEKEVSLTVSSSVLFRSNSMAIKIVTGYAKLIGGKFLRDTLGTLLQEVNLLNESYEVGLCLGTWE
jgi:hypothetical protein